MSKLTDFLPKKQAATMLVQARVPKDMAEAIRAELDRRGLTWNDFALAAGKKFLEDAKAERKKA